MRPEKTIILLFAITLFFAGCEKDESLNRGDLILNGHAMVDLGLPSGLLWATCNVGASSPNNHGDYFAWGETEPKETYSRATYKWCDGTANTFTKYCSNSQYGNADYKTTLDPEDDAAIVHLGGNWRMPTIEEWMELKQNCTWKKITINGMTGYQVTAKNGNSIFLPRAGLRMSNILYAADSVGYYASCNHLPEFSHEDYASYMLMYDNSISKSSARRYYGLPIRPVYDDRPKSKIIWYTDEAIKDGSNGASGTGMAGWAYLHPKGMETTELNRRYQGKRINCIRLQVAQAGTFTVSVANRDRLDSIFNIQTIMLKDPSKEPQVYHLPQTIHLQKNQVLVFANPTDQGRFYYSAYIENITFYGLIGQKGVDIARDRTLHIDAGYYCEDGENCDTLAIETKKMQPKII